jgi:UDP-GlcNAc:undecaprenyl-phosphate/decaprenyl-phosphate GlcNAc-1-phosphate transferase|tara:strand:- start:398 stop:1384 length:987 start_codon:yes stop_codon:yes gene_type:complete
MFLNLSLIIILNLLLYLSNNFIAKIFNIYDVPDKIRKFHKSVVPITGGIFIFINISLYFIVQVFLFQKTLFFEEIDLIFIYLLFTSLFFLLGFIDDKLDINSNFKFFLTSIFIICILFLDPTVIITKVKFSFISFDLNIFSIPWTIVCFLLFINAFNMFDGFNLQSATYSAFLLIVLAFQSQGDYLIFLILIPIIFFGFLNYSNKSFMGDGGTYLISFIIACLFIKLYNQENIKFVDEIVCLMIIPGIDLMRLFVQRIILYRRSPFSADRHHLHHYFLNNFSKNKSLLYLNFLIILPYLVGKFFLGFMPAIVLQLIIYFLLIFRLIKN